MIIARGPGGSGSLLELRQLLHVGTPRLLEPGRGEDRATQLAIGLYIAYNVAATLVSIPAGHVGDRWGARRVLALGVAMFGVAYLGFAVDAQSVWALAPWFIAAGIAIGCVETAEHAAVAAFAPADLRGSGSRLLAGVQSFGNLAASGIAGLLWTVFSPTVAFVYIATWMGASLLALVVTGAGQRNRDVTS